jgi:hypothetical protein
MSYALTSWGLCSACCALCASDPLCSLTRRGGRRSQLQLRTHYTAFDDVAHLAEALVTQPAHLVDQVALLKYITPWTIKWCADDEADRLPPLGS